MSFSLGKPILVMLAAALVTGAAISLRQADEQKDLILWVFANAHSETYRSILDEFERDTGLTVDLQLISGRALPARLESMFMSGVRGRPLPDVVEVESGWIGRFFHPPVHEVGFLPLNEFLKRDGWDQRIVAGRFAPWSKKRVIFGVPHDVHPVTIAYRHDLFDAAGIDLTAAKTWRQFHEMCLEFQQYWRRRGYPHRHAIELPQASSDYIIVMLLQRGINLVDEDQSIHLADPRVAETVTFYTHLVAGPRRIASESAGGTGVWTNDVLAGNLCSFICPDWRVFSLKEYAPQLQGRLRMIPLPRFEPGDAPTSTWGGTMIGIPRHSSNHEAAWKLIEFLYLSETGLKARQRTSNILPPVIEQWNDPLYHRADPYFGGQKVDELYVELAHQIPPRYMTPESTIAQIQLSLVLTRAAAYLNEHGEAGLRAYVERLLQRSADDLRRRIEHGKMAP